MKVQSIERVFDIIEYIANQQGPVTLSQVAGDLGLAASTVHRLLGTLLERGYVEQAAPNRQYKIGIRFIELASQYLRGLELRTEAAPFLRELSRRGGHPAMMATIMDDEIVYIERLDERGVNLRNYSFIGQRRPLYSTGLGKAILMGLPKSKRDHLIAGMTFVRKTANTITDPERLKAELDLSLKRGFSKDDEEETIGFRCVAAPIRDYRNQVIAAVSTSWLSDFFDSVDEDKLASLVVEAAMKISKRMGYDAS
ncbi:MAG: IclR family transcriptional regulator [Desulfobacteraceae bacterium]|jgi:DNA-binding IclR family transcriptional regulator